ncbi:MULTISPECIES: hypothetical protein [unclassified Cytobacillus]|jgi:hypothetical protein|nr:hypothetical protein [Cytobacillus sp. AMY 15.2]
MLKIVWGSGAWMVPDFFVWVVVLIHAGFMGTAFIVRVPFSAS